MDITKHVGLFPYIEGAALVGKPDVALTIAGWAEEEIADPKGNKQQKVTLGFRETSKKLVLNKTNVKRLIGLYGTETDNWKGKRIALYTERVKAFGETHDAVRVRETAPAVAMNGRQAPKQPALEAASEGD